MTEELTANTVNTTTMNLRGITPIGWRCKLFGTDSLVYRPEEGKEPNWFHRKMQGLILGHVWEKVE